ncbi:MAG: Gfo/Idh/MocA family oxidoreductase [Chloroflexota bacterium]
MTATIERITEGVGQAFCRVAIVGAGGMSRQHIRAFKDVPGVQIVGVHSRTRSRAEGLAAEFGVPAVFDSIAAMHDATQADLVVVSVPELSTNAVCKACFEHPWTALIEKPAGYNIIDAEDIEAAVRAKNRRAYVALNRRQYGSTRAVVADLANQSAPRLIKVQDQEYPAAGLKGGQPQIVVDNWMYANAIHLIDFFTVFGRGKITDVVPVIHWDPKLPRYVAARISFDSGDIGLYDAVWNAPGPWAVSVTTPDKRWEMRPVEKATWQVLGTRVLEPAAEDPWDTAFKPGLRRQAELAVRAAAGQSTELPTLSDALVSMRLAQAIYAVA